MVINYNFGITKHSVDNSLPLNQIQSRFKEGLSLHNQGQLASARRIYQQILKVLPKHFDSLHMLGVLDGEEGKLSSAIEFMSQAIQINSSVASVYANRGHVFNDMKQFQMAISDYDKAIQLKPNYAKAYCNRGVALNAMGRLDAAVSDYHQAIAIAPEMADAHLNLGVALAALKQYQSAIDCIDKAISIKPDYADAYCHRGNVLVNQGSLSNALKCYEKALLFAPYDAEIHYFRGVALFLLKQYEQAIESYDRAISIKSDYVDAYIQCGVALTSFIQYEYAIESLQRAIEIKPDRADAYACLGNVFLLKKEYILAVDNFQRALSIEPDVPYVFGFILHAKMRMCNWSNYDQMLDELIIKVKQNKKVTAAFGFLALCSDLMLQRQVAETTCLDRYQSNLVLGNQFSLKKNKKIRIAYYSADFHNHATAYLMAELFELHDKTRFEVFGFSYGPDFGDEMRRRLSIAFDQFIDVKSKSDLEVAELSRQLGIDIAVDLKGYTQDERLAIFAARPAPIQISYLGYPGTLGVDYIDYLIADQTLIPQHSQSHYTEKIVYLPNSYQVNDRTRTISNTLFTREELGLPNHGFVFCCFNNNFKITPETFEGWMRILQQVEGSVLWLFEENAWVAPNLRQVARQHGVDPSRLVFASRMALPEHLSRHRQADLFLDTLPYNAHTTTSDALWAGLPVLTCTGEAFASRVAASLLNAIGLPELITSTQQDYESLAIELACNPFKLTAIRHKLGVHRTTMPLFDTPLFTRHLETAYTEIYDRFHAGLPPDYIYVEPH